MIYWKYDFDIAIAIWQRDPETKRERCLYDSGLPISKEQASWRKWDQDTIEQERDVCDVPITETTEEEAFAEML